MKGFNHVIWLTRFRYMGENAYRYVDDWIREDAEKLLDKYEYVEIIAIRLGAQEAYVK
ncbi:MAG: hypothetical protein QXT53_04960 [Ignisphaera sp.]